MPKKNTGEIAKELYQQSEFYSPEEELILYCSKIYSDPLISDQIQILLARHDLDLEKAFQIARVQGVTPCVYRALLSVTQADIPKKIFDRLRSFYHLNAAKNIFLAEKLVKLVSLLQTNGVPVIPYKGPILAELAYGNLAYCQFGDLDILVHTWDYIFRIESLLLSQGWQKIKNFHWEMSFVDQSGVIVDVHKGISQRTIPFPINFNQLWKQGVDLPICGTLIKTLSPIDMLIIHCVQLLKDTASKTIRLKKICDIAELINENQQMDWHLVIKKSRKLGVLNILYLGIASAHNILGTHLPHFIFKKIQSVPHIDSLVTHVKECTFGRSESNYSYPELLDSSKLHLAVRERKRDNFSVRYRCLLTPDIPDYEFMSLPRNLFFLYHIVRPVRLLIKYIKKFLGL